MVSFKYDIKFRYVLIKYESKYSALVQVRVKL